MCTTHTMTFDGHDYTLRTDAQSRTTAIINADDEPIGTIETSPCGEYFIATNNDNPLGMSSHYHIGSAELDELAQSIISGSY